MWPCGLAVLMLGIGPIARPWVDDADVPGSPVSSRAAKAGCEEWTQQAAGKLLYGSPRCTVEWSWLDDQHRLSRARYEWRHAGNGDRVASLEVLFEELGEDRAWALAGLVAPGEGEIHPFWSRRIGDRLLVRAADCAAGPRICDDFAWEWTPGGKLRVVHSLVETDVTALVRAGYDVARCEVDEETMTAECFACPKGRSAPCCPESILTATVTYESARFRVKALTSERYDLECERRPARP